jgi:hypothetical protein
LKTAAPGLVRTAELLCEFVGQWDIPAFAIVTCSVNLVVKQIGLRPIFPEQLLTWEIRKSLGALTASSLMTAYDYQIYYRQFQKTGECQPGTG